MMVSSTNGAVMHTHDDIDYRTPPAKHRYLLLQTAATVILIGVGIGVLMNQFSNQEAHEFTGFTTMNIERPIAR